MEEARIAIDLKIETRGSIVLNVNELQGRIFTPVICYLYLLYFILSLSIAYI